MFTWLLNLFTEKEVKYTEPLWLIRYSWYWKSPNEPEAKHIQKVCRISDIEVCKDIIAAEAHAAGIRIYPTNVHEEYFEGSRRIL